VKFQHYTKLLQSAKLKLKLQIAKTSLNQIHVCKEYTTTITNHLESNQIGLIFLHGLQEGMLQKFKTPQHPSLQSGSQLAHLPSNSYIS